MKKLLALLLVIVSIFSLASCSLLAAKPELDLEDAKDNLEDAKYTVYLEDDVDEPGIKEYLRAYDEDGENYIYIVVFEDTKLANLMYKQQQLELKSEKENLKIEIQAQEHRLDKYDDDLDSDEIDEIEDDIKDMEKELEELKKEYVIGKSGKTVWYGTKDAIEDSKG